MSGLGKGQWLIARSRPILLGIALGGCAGNLPEAETDATTPNKEAPQAREKASSPAAERDETTETEKDGTATAQASGSEHEISKTLPASFDCSGHTCYAFKTSREVLVPLILHHKAQLIAFGEAHAPRAFSGDTTVKRFTRDLLPTISEPSSHLLLELLNPPKEGCAKERAVAQAESDQVTEGQSKTNQNEYLALGTEARRRGVVPDILWSTCDDLSLIAAPEGGVVVMMETIARLSTKTLKEQLSTLKKGRPLVLAYGGAHHNDLSPKPGLETWSYGPEMLAATKGSYLEVDLIVPELIRDTDSWKSFAWYDAYQALGHRTETILMKWGERSYTLFFAPAE